MRKQSRRRVHTDHEVHENGVRDDKNGPPAVAATALLPSSSSSSSLSLSSSSRPPRKPSRQADYSDDVGAFAVTTAMTTVAIGVPCDDFDVDDFDGIKGSSGDEKKKIKKKKLLMKMKKLPPSSSLSPSPSSQLSKSNRSLGFGEIKGSNLALASAGTVCSSGDSNSNSNPRSFYSSPNRTGKFSGRKSQRQEQQQHRRRQKLDVRNLQTVADNRDLVYGSYDEIDNLDDEIDTHADIEHGHDARDMRNTRTRADGTNAGANSTSPNTHPAMAVATTPTPTTTVMINAVLAPNNDEVVEDLANRLHAELEVRLERELSHRLQIERESQVLVEAVSMENNSQQQTQHQQHRHSRRIQPLILTGRDEEDTTSSLTYYENASNSSNSRNHNRHHRDIRINHSNSGSNNTRDTGDGPSKQDVRFLCLDGLVPNTAARIGRCLITAILLLSVGVAIGVVFGKGGSSSGVQYGGNNNTPTVSPPVSGPPSNNDIHITPGPTNSPTFSNGRPGNARFRFLVDLIGQNVTHQPHIVFSDSRTIEYAAMDWIATNDEWQVIEDDNLPMTTNPNKVDNNNIDDVRRIVILSEVLIERYVMVLFYLSTNGRFWKNTLNFLLPTSICQWHSNDMGVICTNDLPDDARVMEIEIGTFMFHFIFEAIGSFSSGQIRLLTFVDVSKTYIRLLCCLFLVCTHV